MSREDTGFRNLSEEDLRELARPPEWISPQVLAAIGERIEAQAKAPPQPVRKGVDVEEAMEELIDSLSEDLPSLRELRLSYCRAVCHKLGGNKSATARVLGISRRQVIRLMTGR